MLKKRIVPILLWSEGRLVKSKQFSELRTVGHTVKTLSMLSDQDADELLILRIDGQPISEGTFLCEIKESSERIQVPLAVGGGVACAADANLVFEHGADKVVINSICYRDPDSVTDLVSIFGGQSVSACVDFISAQDGYSLYSSGKLIPHSLTLEAHCRNLEALGVGEIILQSVNRDGMREGFDLATLNSVLSLVRTPIIAAGGAGNYDHLRQALTLGVDAVACGSLFVLGDNNPVRAKSFLRNRGVTVRRSL